MSFCPIEFYFKQKLQDFKVSFGVEQSCSPGIQAVACYKDSVGLARKVGQESIHQACHGLAVVHNRHLDGGCVGRDSLQSFLHFPTFKCDVAIRLMGSRQHRGRDGMTVQNCPCFCFPDDRHVQSRFGADAAAAFNDVPIVINDNQVIDLHASFIHTARGH